MADGQDAEIIIAGLSKDGPRSYVINISDDLPMGVTSEQAAAAEYLPPPFKLHRLPEKCVGPVLTDTIKVTAGYAGVDLGQDEAGLDAAFRLLIECQRHSDYGDGISWVGGYCEITTISGDGIEQRVLHRWEEDTVGELISPRPLDFAKWRAAHVPAKPAFVAPRWTQQDSARTHGKEGTQGNAEGGVSISIYSPFPARAPVCLRVLANHGDQLGWKTNTRHWNIAGTTSKAFVGGSRR